MDKRRYFTGWTDEKIADILTNPYYAKRVEALKTAAEKYLATDIKILNYSDMHLFEETGNRSQFESIYFEYQSRLNTYSLAYMFFKDERYIMPLADIIWQICNFETWSLSAHVRENEPLDKRRCWLELGSTLLARDMAIALYITGDKLPALVVKRATAEIRERVIEGYQKYDFWWMKTTNNWGAVCIAGVLGAYLFCATEQEIEAAIPKMLKTAELYLTGFDSDGVCLEGYGYWTYGFTHYCEFADMLRNYTEGRINLFADERVHKVAKFQENCAINEKECIRFSDCNGDFSPSAPLAHFLKGVYPDVQIPSIPAPVGSAGFYGFFWLNPALTESKMEFRSVIYRDAQWFIHRSDAYNFVCKGGSNNEPHNHNDVGSFMISKNGRVTFTDPGGGDYTRQYFGAERYTILEPSARSHSVPIINGEFQVKKSEKSVVYKEAENEYEFSIENGYNIPTLTSLRRHFVCEENAVILTDTYSFSEQPKSVVERFVTLVEPEIGEGFVKVGASTLVYDTSVFEFTLNHETCVRKKGIREELYMLDLKVKNPEKEMSLSVKFC